MSLSGCDIGDIVQRHRRRLEEHRRFLQGEGPAAAVADRSGGGNGDGNATGFTATAAPRSQRAKAVTPERDGAVHTPRQNHQQQQHNYSASSRAGAAGHKFTSADEAPRGFEEPSLGPAEFLHPPRARPSSAASTRKEGFAGAASASTGGSGSVAQPPSPRVGAYVTGDPAAVYERSRQWQRRREHETQRLREEAAHREAQECAFRPNTALARSAATTPSRAGASSQVQAQAQAWPPPPSQQLQHAPSSQSPYRAGSGRAVGALTIQALDESAALHVRRQAAAREERAATRRRAETDTSSWKPHTTVPIEFQFGQRGALAAHSLRKPVVPQSGYAARLAASQHGVGSTRGAAGGVHVLTNGSDDPQPPPTARRWRAEGATDEAGSGFGSAVAKGFYGLISGDSTKTVTAFAAIEDRVAEQALEMAQMRTELQATQRELAVARGKVRQLALAQQSSR